MVGDGVAAVMYKTRISLPALAVDHSNMRTEKRKTEGCNAESSKSLLALSAF